MQFHERRTNEDIEISPRLNELYGSNDPDKIFGAGVKAPVPWPRAGQRKNRQMYDPEIVRNELMKPVRELEDVDPRTLHATQPHLVHSAVAHYMGEQWRKTGQTYADQSNVGNQYPFVYTRRDESGVQNILLSGHHRAAAALLKGRALSARRVEGGWGPER